MRCYTGNPVPRVQVQGVPQYVLEEYCMMYLPEPYKYILVLKVLIGCHYTQGVHK